MQTVLPNAVSSPAAARKVVAEELAERCGSKTMEAAQLLISELVTNAVLHASGQIHLSVSCRGGRVRAEVRDGSSAAPTRRRASGHATTGRGLILVEALATVWGVQRREDGKTVWFELAGGNAS